MALLITFSEIEITTSYGKIMIVTDGENYVRKVYWNITGTVTETKVDEETVSHLLKTYRNSYRILR